ncbi:MAG: rod shape-determining protein MreC [Coriobacteriaceae bacterium]|nr:rod shape-determining protein MreC [Coriobacteriaceae bacterium]
MIVLCLVSLLILTFYLREGESGPIHAARGAVMTITAPVRSLGSVVAAPFNALGNIVSNATASGDTLSELKKKNEELTAQVAELSEAHETAERLEKLVGLKSTYNLESTAARIIGSTGDSWSDTVVIDKGANAGFEPGMAVCSSGGVIGQIIEVSPTTATVRLLNDEQSGISAMVQGSRAQGMLSGQADGTLRLEYVVADAQVSAGDIIITSGIGGTFPKGLPLGTVASVERSANAVYYSIVVRPASSAENNEEVLVITTLNDEQRASEADVADANSAPQGVDPKKDAAANPDENANE